MIRATLLAAAIAIASTTAVAGTQECVDLRQQVLTQSTKALEGIPLAPRFDGEERMPNPARAAQIAQQSLQRILSESKTPNPADKGATLTALMSSHRALLVAGEMKQAANQYDAGSPGQKYTLRMLALNADLVRYADCIGAMLHSMAVQP